MRIVYKTDSGSWYNFNEQVRREQPTQDYKTRTTIGKVSKISIKTIRTLLSIINSIQWRVFTLTAVTSALGFVGNVLVNLPLCMSKTETLPLVPPAIALLQSFAKQMLLTSPWCPLNVWISVPVANDLKYNFWSSQAASRNTESADTSSMVTADGKTMLFNSVNLSRHQRQTVQSEEPETRISPAESTRMEFTGPLWWSTLMRTSPVRRLVTIILESSPPLERSKNSVCLFLGNLKIIAFK